MISLAGFSITEGAPGYVVYVQVKESSITNGSNGVYEIHVKDIFPYTHIAEGKKSHLIPVDILTNLTNPMNAARVYPVRIM